MGRGSQSRGTFELEDDQTTGVFGVGIVLGLGICAVYIGSDGEFGSQ